MIYRDTDVGNLRDLGLMLDVVGKHFARLRQRRENILNSRTQPEDRQVADHAIVRYLERVEGIDIEAVKNRLRAYVETMEPTPVKGVLRHPQSGIQTIINRSGLVVTFLPNEAELGYESKY